MIRGSDGYPCGGKDDPAEGTNLVSSLSSGVVAKGCPLVALAVPTTMWILPLAELIHWVVVKPVAGVASAGSGGTLLRSTDPGPSDEEVLTDTLFLLFLGGGDPPHNQPSPPQSRQAAARPARANAQS